MTNGKKSPKNGSKGSKKAAAAPKSAAGGKKGGAAVRAPIKSSTKLIAVILVVVLVAGAGIGIFFLVRALTRGGNDIIQNRYETVRVSDIRTGSGIALSAHNPTDNASSPYYLASSYYDDDTNYYIYYLGYINSVPIVSGDAIRYNGQTQITITYTKDSSVETAVTESMTTAYEYTTTNSKQLNVGVEVTGGYKWAVGAHLSVMASVSSSFTWEQSNTRSTSSTVERAESRMSGESFSIEATIGANNEKSGTYRYSLFGTTDAYYVLELDRSNTTLKDANTIYCARNNIAWGIDYASDGVFDKDSDTENLVIPDDDYSTLALPTEKIQGAVIEPENPTTEWTSLSVSTGWINATSPGVTPTKVRGDEEIDDQKDKDTAYTFEARVTQGNTPQYVNVDFTYIVTEDRSKDPSELKLTYTKVVDLGHSKMLELSQINSYQSVSGTDPKGRKSSGADGTFIHIFGNLLEENLVRFLDLRVDGPGNDLDADGIAFNASIRLWYLKDLT